MVEFTECFRTVWTTPYIAKLSLSAGIGWLSFGYDTGLNAVEIHIIFFYISNIISGALLHIKEDFKSVDQKTWLQETIVSMAVAGAIFGAGFGGWMNDRFGRKPSILLADVLFFVGALIMALAPSPWVIIVGRIFVGFGVGMASMTGPLYISESSPARIRGALVSSNMLLITRGQFLSYLITLAFTKTPGTWRWMLGVGGVPAIVQFFLMLMLPESPKWLDRKNKVEEAEAILRKIYPEDEVVKELQLLEQSVKNERAGEEDLISKLKGAFGNKIVRRGLYAGITVQVAKQFLGINTVLYYSPTIVQFAGFAAKSTAMALALVLSGLNAIGSIVGMSLVDRTGRRKLMIVSMFGTISCLLALTVLFSQPSIHGPSISQLENSYFGANATCLAYQNAKNAGKWNCMSCVKAKCSFCTNGGNQYLPGACLADNNAIEGVCTGEHRTYFNNGCPSQFGFLAVVFLGLYIICYSPGMVSIPWIVNSEIYPLRYRGIGGGIAAVSNWSSNLIVSETFLTLTEALGTSGTVLLFAGFSAIGLVAIYFLVPETKGLTIEEVEKMLEKGFKPGILRKKNAEDVESSTTT